MSINTAMYQEGGARASLAREVSEQFWGLFDLGEDEMGAAAAILDVNQGIALSDAIPVSDFEAHAPVLAAAKEELRPSPALFDDGFAGVRATAASPHAQPGLDDGVFVTAEDAAAAVRAAQETMQGIQQHMGDAHVVVWEEGGVREEEPAAPLAGGVDGQEAAVGEKRGRADVGQGGCEAAARGKAARTEEKSEEGVRLAESRKGWKQWKQKREELGAEYADRLRALPTEGRRGVEDAMALKTASHKHKVMHVTLQYLMALGIVVHCDTEGAPCAFPAVSEGVDKGGRRYVREPRGELGGKCAFGGYQGFQVVRERAQEFLRHWTAMLDMEVCPEHARVPELHMALGLCHRDWTTLTEQLSNQKNKFGFVPMPPRGGAGGGQMSWVKAMEGKTPIIYKAAEKKADTMAG